MNLIPQNKGEGLEKIKHMIIISTALNDEHTPQ